MSFDITLTINQPREEAYSPAWSAFHTASGAHFTSFRTDYVHGGLTAEDRPSLPSDFWQEPCTGVIMLRPSFMTIDRLGTSYVTILTEALIDINAAAQGGTTEGGGMFSYSASTAGSALSSIYKGFSQKLKSRTDTRLGLTVTGQYNSFMTLADKTGHMVWNLQTGEALAPNQGFAVILCPAGIFSDWAGDYFSIGFGGKFIMHFTTAGIAQLFADLSGNGDWSIVAAYDLAAGGVNHTHPFQMSIIPFGKRYLSIQFSQNPGHGSGAAFSFNDTKASFIYTLPKEGNLAPRFDGPLNQWVKTESSAMAIGLRTQFYAYDFIIMKALYIPGETDLKLTREYLRVAPGVSNPPVISVDGIDGANDFKYGGNTSVTVMTTLNDKNTAFDPTSDTVVVPWLNVQSSGAVGSAYGLYTPELWSYGVKVDCVIATPGISSKDASPRWQLIRFQRTTDPSATPIELKLMRDAEMPQLLKRDGPVRISIKDNSGNDTLAAEGYIARSQPTVVGPKGLIVDQVEAKDMWRRLKRPLHLQSVAGDVIAEKMKTAIMDCGFQDADVYIDYTNSPELAGITFQKLTNPADVLQPNDDTTTEDWIRSICEQVTAQFRPPMRVRWLPDPGVAGHMRWVIYLPQTYDPGRTTRTFGPCHHRFFLDEAFMSVFVSEQLRYQAHEFLLTGNPEFTLEEPEFNAIEFTVTATRSGTGGSTINQTAFDYIAAPPRVVDDPTYVGYQGYEDLKHVSTETAQKVGIDDQAMARAYYDLNYNLKLLASNEFEGEWQPEIDCDQFVQIIGISNFADADRGIAVGDPISFGAWRIDHIDVEIRHDGPVNAQSANRRWEWAGSYTMKFVGKAEGTITYLDPSKTDGSTLTKTLKMFAPDEMLPLDSDEIDWVSIFRTIWP